MYKLYYIRGINRLDTPYFSTLQEQATYFESKKILEIDYIYPPHYRDTIDFDITDLDMKTQANYLSINFNNKTYYYFIDNVVYINEEMIQISITMDVIQTYMFDIDYIHCDVARRTIDRWNDDGTINRNYLRENLSNGDMVLKDTGFDVTPLDLGWCIIEYSYSKPYNEGDHYNKKVLTDALGASVDYETNLLSNNFFNKEIKFNSNKRTFLIPYSITGNKDIKIVEYYKDNEDIRLTINYNEIMPSIYEMISAIGKMENVLSIRFISQNIFKSLNIQETDNEIVINYHFSRDFQSYLQYYKKIEYASGDPIHYQIAGITLYNTNFNIQKPEPIEIKTFTSTHTFNYKKQINLEYAFDKIYVPALLDENYIQYQYGEKINLTSCPFYQMNNPIIYNKHTYDITTGYRLYCITDNINASTDKYKTLIYVTTEENYTLSNNAWNTYLSQNQATLTRGLRLNHIKNIYDVIPNTVKNVSTGNVGGAIANVADAAFNVFNINEKLNITKENLQFTPDTIKLGNAINSDILSESIFPCYYIYEVNDIDKVAEQYEAYGYKVNEHYSKVNILDVLNTRYYYNVIKCEDMEINLKVLNDELTITRIKDRFNSGLRLWNIKNLKSYMQMGDLFVYDNVEKKYLE